MTAQGTDARGPFDPGLQPERTELAWRRTALAIAIGSLVSLRIFPLVLPPAGAAWGFAPGAIGLAAACALWFAARRRQLRMTAWLLSTRHDSTPRDSIVQESGVQDSGVPSPPGGAMLLVLTVLAMGFGALCLAIVVVSSLAEGAH